MMRFLVLAVTALVLILSTVQPGSGSRVLDGEKDEWMKIRIIPLRSILQSGSVPPSGPSSCTKIPEPGSPCPSGKKLAGHTTPPQRCTTRNMRYSNIVLVGVIIFSY